MKKIECTFYRPNPVNIREFSDIVDKLESDLSIVCSDDASEGEIHTYAEALLSHARPLNNNSDMYFLGLDEPRNMPSDARVDFFYTPTYIGSAIIMKAVMKHSDLLKMHESTIRGLLLGCTGRGFRGHGYDGLKGMIEALKIFAEADCGRFIEKYPNVCKEFSRLYNKSMNELRKLVDEDKVHNAWGSDYTEMAKEVLECNGAIISEVWYASYGSNMSYERFMGYISRCSDTSCPVESRAFTLPFEMYFAGESRTWGRKHGVAFIDDTKEGICLGRIYRVKHSQFLELQQMEGSKYTKRLSLGTVDDLPVYTFTSPEKRSDVQAPSADYIQTIMTGLLEMYPNLNGLTALSYLIRYGALGEDDRRVLLCIRNSEHAIDIQTISASSFIAITRTKAAVKKLSELKLIMQDGRSVRAGHRLNDPEALFYTCPEMRDLIAQVQYGII